MENFHWGNDTSPEHKRGVTFMGLCEWYKRMFEHLGYMLLCKDNTSKINAYKSGITNLIRELEEKEMTLSSPDKKQDVRIMLENVRILKDHISKDFLEGNASNLNDRPTDKTQELYRMEGGAKKNIKNQKNQKNLRNQKDQEVDRTAKNVGKGFD